MYPFNENVGSIQAAQGWSENSMLHLCAQFIQQNNLMNQFESFLADKALEKEDEKNAIIREQQSNPEH